MKRRIALATLSSLCLSAAPAFAQRYKYNERPVTIRDHRDRYQPAHITSFSPHSGAAGTVVTIYGDNFLRGTQVLFDGQLITPSRVSEGLISFSVPSGASDSSIALRAPRMRGDLSVGSFDVVNPYSPPPKSSWNRGREGRRRSWISGLRGRWNRGFLANPKVKFELSLHARRTARLERMLNVASVKRNSKLIVRIRAAIRKESRRHDRKMSSLKAELRIG